MRTAWQILEGVFACIGVVSTVVACVVLWPWIGKSDRFGGRW